MDNPNPMLYIEYITQEVSQLLQKMTSLDFFSIFLLAILSLSPSSSFSALPPAFSNDSKQLASLHLIPFYLECAHLYPQEKDNVVYQRD